MDEMNNVMNDTMTTESVTDVAMPEVMEPVATDAMMVPEVKAKSANRFAKLMLGIGTAAAVYGTYKFIRGPVMAGINWIGSKLVHSEAEPEEPEEIMDVPEEDVDESSNKESK